MTEAAATSALEARVGHHYQMDGTYLVGREKLREYARAVQDYHPAHWDVAAAAELGYPDVVAPLTFTSTPGMKCNRRMFESIVVGYDTYLQTEEVFEQHRPIVAGDELAIDVELTSVRRIAGRDLITVTNTFTDTAGERVHTLHTTVVGVTAEDVDPRIKDVAHTLMMHDVNILDIDGSDATFHKTLRPAGVALLSLANVAFVRLRPPGLTMCVPAPFGFQSDQAPPGDASKRAIASSSVSSACSCRNRSHAVARRSTAQASFEISPLNVAEFSGDGDT